MHVGRSAEDVLVVEPALKWLLVRHLIHTQERRHPMAKSVSHGKTALNAALVGMVWLHASAYVYVSKSSSDRVF